MKNPFSALGVLVLALGALASQSCESTDGQHVYYYRNHYGYYNDGRYAHDNGYYDNRGYVPNGYDDRPGIDVHF